MRRPMTLRETFECRVEKGEREACWPWRGSMRRQNGYGVVHYNGQRLTAHRVSYELYVGAIPDDLTLDHLCRNRSCVNPAHLEPVTNAGKRASDRADPSSPG